MAEPVPFKQQNVIFGRGANDERVCELPAFMHADGIKEVISCWRLTAPELEEVQRTGVVWIRIMGENVYPFTVQGTSPWPAPCAS